MKFVPSKKDIVTHALIEYHKTFFKIKDDVSVEVRLISFKEGVLYAEVEGPWKWKSLLDIGRYGPMRREWTRHNQIMKEYWEDWDWRWKDRQWESYVSCLTVRSEWYDTEWFIHVD